MKSRAEASNDPITFPLLGNGPAYWQRKRTITENVPENIIRMSHQLACRRIIDATRCIPHGILTFNFRHLIRRGWNSFIEKGHQHIFTLSRVHACMHLHCPPTTHIFLQNILTLTYFVLKCLKYNINSFATIVCKKNQTSIKLELIRSVHSVVKLTNGCL